MPAGGSAQRRSAELTEQSDALFELARLKEAEARNYVAACNSERELAEVIRPLSRLRWHVLEDRLWPGSKRANVDFLLVGPGGLVVLDAKQWAEVEIRDDSVYRGDSREDGELEKLASLADRLVDELVDTGLVSAAITIAMVFTNHDMEPTRVGPITVMGANHVVAWMSRLRERLTVEQAERVHSRVVEVCPAIAEKPTSERRLGLRRARPTPRQAAQLMESLIDVEAITEALLERSLAGPIEDWMTFLHPDQNKLVRTHYEGPARIRGPAGTGKTVVGLHRAVHLAERSQYPVLFTSYVRTLPVVMRALAERLSSSAVENIEFIGVHALAADVLDNVGASAVVNTVGINNAFTLAWQKTKAQDHLATVDARPSYWKEEIDYVIKGRGLIDFTEYRDLSRVGRRTALRRDLRAAVWDLYVAYEANLDHRGIHDFNDLLILARDAVRRFPQLFTYGSVIIDEVQDLPLVALQFLAALAGDGANKLLIIGDGQQSVYPGGFTLAEAGIVVTGRSTVLQINYRNTVEILDAAARLVSGDSFEDLDGEPLPGTRDTQAARHGHHPMTVHAASSTDLDTALVRQITRTHDVLGVAWGDLAVLAERLREVEHYQRVLDRAGIPQVELTEYDGTTSDQVKVGTFKRAKGLDFKYVLMPGLTTAPPDPWPGEADESYAERVERRRRELYVGMTRARDGLWLGYLDTADSGDAADSDATVSDAELTVAELADKLWGVAITSLDARFAARGWNYGEPFPGACPGCAGALHTFDMPYEAYGRQMQHAALVCPTCEHALSLSDLGIKRRSQLRAISRRPKS